RWDKDNVIGVQNLVVQESEWISGSANPTYVSGTQFTVPNDQTTTFQVGRRIKTTQTSGTEYGTIVNSAFTTLTTVDVEMDSTNLDSGLSNVDVSVL
ncbi:MAG: hypothetical protein GWN13_11195, partial [Phycisphaerae bacterium]|nr:hypothetical protein [Phycisphaerae bacterium]